MFNATNGTNDICFMSVFGVANLQKWVLGAHFFKMYMGIFDLTPIQNYEDANFINIALIPRKTNLSILSVNPQFDFQNN